MKLKTRMNRNLFEIEQEMLNKDIFIQIRFFNSGFICNKQSPFDIQ